MKPVDFTQLSLDIIAAGAADDYETPLGHDIDMTREGTFSEAHCPQYPGDPAYFHGPYILKFFGEDLPQGLIDAHHKSVRDALKHYLPPETVTQHLCMFFQGDFTNSDAYEEILSKNLDAIPSRPNSEAVNGTDDRFLNPDLSFKFGDAAHRSQTRVYFTLPELDAVQEACYKRPDIYKTIFAFQAGFFDYTMKLDHAFSHNPAIPDEKKSRALKITDMFISQWASANFALQIVPFMALAYHERDPQMTSEVIGDDFRRGFEIATRLGLFRHTVLSKAGLKGERNFACPARITIGTIMARDEEHAKGSPSFIGAMLAMIHARLPRPGDDTPNQPNAQSRHFSHA